MVIKALMVDTTNTFPEQILHGFAIPTFIDLENEMRGQGRKKEKNRDESKSQSDDNSGRESRVYTYLQKEYIK